MKKIKISVIVPVYNSAQYLKKCLDSLINQTIDINHIQLILVNDGSTDDSERIIKKYQIENPEIVYIKKSNGGQASARNRGLEEAVGDYVSFIDSDDWIDDDMLAVLYQEASVKSLDIVMCDYTMISDTSKKYVSFRFAEDDVKNFILTSAGPCNMIIKRELLMSNNFKFPEGIIYEDIAVIPALALHHTKIGHVSKSLYNYWLHANSTMNHTNYNKRLADIFSSLEILKNQFKEYDRENIYGQELEYIYIRRLLMSASLRFIEFNDPEKCLEKIVSIMKENYSNWQKNKYYLELPATQKLVAILTYNRHYKLLKLLTKLNKRRKS